VAEEYFHGNRADSLNDVRSVTKSIVSMLVGIAIDQGALPGITAPIADYLPADAVDPVKGAITIEQLLTMSSGFDWDETSTASYNDWVRSVDPIEYLLSRPLVSLPGREFRYNSAAVHLLSVVLEAATGMSTIEYARRNLFEPLGITAVQWEVFPDGRANGGAGIDLRPTDLAKLGVLWLQQGDAGGRQIVEPAWIAAATAPRFGYWDGKAPLADQSYGYLWWLNRAGGSVHSFAWGFGGQFVWVAPELDLVTVVTTEWRNAGSQAELLARQGQDLVVNHVIPSVR
jgi:CubicO group peptidase (beta-lactamase class C family)